jgi:alanine racemase
MKFNRRKFIGTSTLGALALAVPKAVLGKGSRPKVNTDKRFDPWIEVNANAIAYNIKQLYRISGNSPIMAVIKNNGYGLGTVQVAKIIEGLPEVVSFAAVKPEACLSLRDAGIKKPVLHMGMTPDAEGMEMVAKNIHLSTISGNTQRQLAAFSEKLNKKVKTHIYLDTGMSRMGIPYHKALPVIEDLNKSKRIEISGTYAVFTEDEEYDKEQLKRFKDLATKARNTGLTMGKLHMASSAAVFNFGESMLDMIRPGLAMYGGYPTDFAKEKEIAHLKVGFSLKTRVVRVEQIRAGDSVSYGRRYVAQKPTWLATLPIGHADGYLRHAVKGAKVYVGGKLYPVIGYVSASHTILEIGDTASVAVGDIATLYGSDHEEINPNHVSEVTGTSIYDILMHLSAKIPKTTID